MNGYDVDRLLRQLHLHRNPALDSYTVVDNKVVWAILHYPYYQSDWTTIPDMTVIFENILQFSDSNEEPLIDIETLVGFDERISDDDISTYYLLTDGRELTIVTKQPFQVIDLRAEH